MPIVADIIAVGTELLLGEVVNSNAAWLSQQLSALGIHVYYHHTVGDNVGRIHRLLDTILNREQDRPHVLLFSGGLGPTPDDLTVDALAKYFQVPLIHDADSERHIRQLFYQRGITSLSDNNLKQALRPEAAQVVPNPMGTAPGIWWHTPKQVYLATFPGVPRELKAMWPTVQTHLQDVLAAAEPGKPYLRLYTRYLHFFGIGESKIAEQVNDLFSSENPTVAPYVDKAHVKLRVACMALNESDAARLLDPLEDDIIQRLSTYYLTTSTEPFQLEAWVGSMLRAAGQTVAVAESCTGGLISHRLTNVSGSSSFTLLNVVTYSNMAKVNELHVPADIILSHGAVSVPVVLAMARGIRKKAKSTYGIGISGVAGPLGGTDQKPVGLAYVAISGPNNQELVQEVRVNPRTEREDVKYAFSQHVLVLLARQLQQSLQTTTLHSQKTVN
jgi:nicotinamide-nucleotide amidase